MAAKRRSSSNKLAAKGTTHDAVYGCSSFFAIMDENGHHLRCASLVRISYLRVVIAVVG